MEVAKYKCRQSELYLICMLGWKSCRLNLSLFTNFKPRYTDTYIDDRIAEVLAAENLPDDQARGGKSEALRVKLKQQATTCLTMWQYLKRYIVSAKAFSGDDEKPALEIAGQNLYLEASQDNWEIVRSLLNSGQGFITNNLALLTADDNMPPAFPTTYSTEKTKFNTLLEDFLGSEETEVEETSDKVEANNKIYDQLMEMFLDGQLIFKEDESTRKRFTFTDVLYLVSGAGTSGIRGIVTDAQTNLSLMDVTVTINPKNLTTTTGNEGFYSILQVGQGIYNITFEKAGYQTQTLQDFEIKLGTTSKVDIALMPE